MLSPTGIEFFNDQGYLKLGKLLSDPQITELRTLADAELQKARGQNRSQWDVFETESYAQSDAVFRLSRLMSRHPAFQRVALDERVVEAMQQLIGPDAAVCLNRHNMMVVKAPQVGRQIDWHQDGANWANARMLAFMVFIDDAGPENGCLEIIPGAHRRGLFKTAASRVGEGMDLSDAVQAELVKQALPVAVQAGEGLLFHSCLPHFSKANSSARFRRNLTFAYIAEADRNKVPAGYAAVETLPLSA